MYLGVGLNRVGCGVWQAAAELRAAALLKYSAAELRAAALLRTKLPG